MKKRGIKVISCTPGDFKITAAKLKDEPALISFLEHKGWICEISSDNYLIFHHINGSPSLPTRIFKNEYEQWKQENWVEPNNNTRQLKVAPKINSSPNNNNSPVNHGFFSPSPKNNTASLKWHSVSTGLFLIENDLAFSVEGLKQEPSLSAYLKDKGWEYEISPTGFLTLRRPNALPSSEINKADYQQWKEKNGIKPTNTSHSNLNNNVNLNPTPEASNISDIVHKLNMVAHPEEMDLEIDALEKTLEKDPKNAEILIKLGELYGMRAAFFPSTNGPNSTMASDFERAQDRLAKAMSIGNSAQKIQAAKILDNIINQEKISSELSTCLMM